MRSLSGYLRSNFSGVNVCSVGSCTDTSDDVQEVLGLQKSIAGVLRQAFQPVLGLKVPSVQKTVVRDVTLSTKLKVWTVGVAIPDVSSR